MILLLIVVSLFLLVGLSVPNKKDEKHKYTKTDRINRSNYSDRYSHQQINTNVSYTSENELKERIKDLPEVKVDYVIDGDTVIVVKNWQKIKIRLDSIDCPENGQHWGDNAKYGLMKLIAKKWVRIEEHGIDTYNRTIATLYVKHKDGSEWINVNERMVTLGHAWVMRRFYDHLPKDRQTKLNRLERWSKNKKVGLWNSSESIPPWQWRNSLCE